MIDEFLHANRGGRRTPREARHDHWSGIKFFRGAPLPDQETLNRLIPTISVDNLREEKHVWRPEETVEAGRIFFGLETANNKRSGIEVIGEPQSGKGTILFGLSEICDILNIGYLFIDGHHQEVSGIEVADAIHKAERLRIPIFFDSTDYLFLKSRSTGRSISQQFQDERVPVIMNAINNASVPIAITRHDDQWAEEFLNLDLRDKNNAVLETFQTYTLPAQLQSDASRHRFLLDGGLPETIASYLLGIKFHNLSESALASLINDIYYPTIPTEKDYEIEINKILTGLRTFAVLKDLVRGEKNHTINCVEKILDANKSEDIRILAIKELAWLILNLYEKSLKLTQIRRKKVKI
ncbi:hypothetical protein A2954_03025 [Candidatus Roizmanbacteria bacterium RIFCSPLOWO2_01_FULL_37_12]|uniref:ATPase AAA-type core domain-containing protein n=1 Tax=Candidatus Roizmanbacteria bacterium RIFCSPLOWO2_01_FULL_37_12 TaxID=1802056 RepID=A0A1F7IAF6_9BACT|nr:MAG: hypothetical protein A3D76_04315 [Candidatus Roizmanbacteria bacterium RIFCSPHIGHO2_02_FULL_37_9b]OGK40350.1 MAG: hypothetical protein A2954_03025 [Candidatus Roizmanbacteria bacterium RIFCSPLOWO2_01_FULL_37_12]